MGPAGSDADEQRYLAEIEALYGLAIPRIPLAPFEGLVRGAEAQVRAAEGPSLDFMWGVTEAVFAEARRAGARVMLTGHWGDQMLFSPAYLVDLFRRLRWGDIWRHPAVFERYGVGDAGTFRRYFLLDLARHVTPAPLVPPLKWLRRRLPGAIRAKPWFTPAFRRLALRDANRPASLGNGFHSATARAVYLEARNRYHVHAMELNNKIAASFGFDTAFPFLDRDLVALLMAMPGDVQCRGGVPRRLLRECMGGILPEPIRSRTWKADFTEPTNRSVARDIDQVAAVLTGDCAAVRAGILDGGRLAADVPRLAAGLTGPDADDGWELADLFGLETWVRVFLGAGGDGGGLPSAGPDPVAGRTA